ncbi:MAG TPA: energy transducer TonB [Saprospiraceae bacterium]|nr:energy transducer TonB [Saprospiraceae bacterium]MCB9327070.1 energy transducer TonB [Lewinellaceae bacterium]HPK09152.1 energy transducer TonB [Saprospiraceae bacterium]HRX28072.1 energy transducer TonB [Saprospiraceae bacterium]
MSSNKSDVDKKFIKKPYYEGGSKAMQSFIYSSLKYPKEAFENRVEGVVHLKYEVDYLGSVKSVGVVSGIGFGCDEEAMRVVKLLKFKVPKTPRKLKVSFNKTIRVQFKLPKPQETQKIHYEIASDSDKSNSYNYTIQW